MEWAILLLVVPAIFVPIALLCGYAGCSYNPSPGALPPPDPPTNLRVTEVGFNSVSLAWDYLNPLPDGVTFQVERTGPAGPQPAAVTTLNLEDTGLSEGTTYTYVVVALNDVGPSEPSNSVSATTLSWKTILDTSGITPNPQNGTGAAGDCVVQRLNGVAQGGSLVRVTLRGIVNETTILTAVTVSPAVPAVSPEPWDSAALPTAVTFSGAGGTTIAGGGIVVSDPISHTVTQGQDLLVAMDVGNGSGRVLRRDVPGAIVFVGSNRAEAALTDRSAGFNTENNRVYIIEQVEVA